jgi:hypothetical protein
MLRFCTLAILAASPLVTQAQAPNAGALAQRSRDALAPIAKIVGQWSGEARVLEGPGEAIRVRQSEDVSFGAAGTVIQIRGTGRNPATDAISFEAVAMLWFDPQQGKVRMRSHRDGNSIEPEVELRPDTLVWGFQMPAGRVRYVIALSDSAWHEVGTFERSGAAPIQILDMRLRRTTPSAR